MCWLLNFSQHLDTQPEGIPVQKISLLVTKMLLLSNWTDNLGWDWILKVGALDSGLASQGKSVMQEIMITSLTKKTGRNVQPISLLQGFLKNFLLYGTCLVYKI